MPKLNIDFKQLFSSFEDIRDSGQFTEGRYERMFEEAVSEWSGMHAIAVSSCGAGLFAMMRVLRGPAYPPPIVPVALVPNNTFYATGAMAREAGFDVRLLDCRRDDFCLDLVETVHAAAKYEASIVVLTHVGGGLAKDYGAIADYCRGQGTTLIEDAAHAFGVGGGDSDWICAGSLSKGAVFSLYPTKAIPVGEMGVIVTTDADFAEELRVFRNYGKHVVDGVIKYSPGFNLRTDEWRSAIALLQIQRRNEILELREACAERLSRVVIPMVDWDSGQSNWYKFIAPADFPAKRQSGKVYQRSDQLQTAMGYPKIGFDENYPNCAWVADNHICLPLDEGMYEGMTTGEIHHYLTGV